MKTKLEPSNHIVRSLISDFKIIDKNSRLIDHNASGRVLSQSIVNKNTQNIHFLKPSTKIIKVNANSWKEFYHIRTY